MHLKQMQYVDEIQHHPYTTTTEMYGKAIFCNAVGIHSTSTEKIYYNDLQDIYSSLWLIAGLKTIMIQSDTTLVYRHDGHGLIFIFWPIDEWKLIHFYM